MLKISGPTVSVTDRFLLYCCFDMYRRSLATTKSQTVHSLCNVHNANLLLQLYSCKADFVSEILILHKLPPAYTVGYLCQRAYSTERERGEAGETLCRA